MPRILRTPDIALTVEWGPALQQMAGRGADALPRWLLEHGWRLQAASHVAVQPLTGERVPALTERLLRAR